jgi:hypothetical protein
MQPEWMCVLSRWEELLLRAMVLLQFVLSLLWRDFLLNTVAVLLLLGRTEIQYSRVPIIHPSVSNIPFYLTCCVKMLQFINSHSGRLNSIETSPAYIEQQREATTTDILLFRNWCDLTAKKRKEAQKQIPITNFLKK